MDAPFGEKLEITEITSNYLIADKKWKMTFLGNAPSGWEPGDEIRLSRSPSLSNRPGGSTGESDARVSVENLTKKSVPITLFWKGSVSTEKSMNIISPSESQLSLRKNIRLDKEAIIKTIHPGYVIDVEDAEGRLTKWQLDKNTARGPMRWVEKDPVVITDGTIKTRNKIINKHKDRYNQELGALFISEE